MSVEFRIRAARQSERVRRVISAQAGMTSGERQKIGMKGCPSAASQRKRNAHAPSDSAELSGSVPRRKACGCVAGQTERARRRGRNRAACAESRFNSMEIKAGAPRFFSLFGELRTEGLREQDFEALQSVADMQAASICAGSSRSAASQEPICSRRNWAAVSAHACSSGAS